MMSKKLTPANLKVNRYKIKILNPSHYDLVESAFNKLDVKFYTGNTYKGGKNKSGDKIHWLMVTNGILTYHTFKEISEGDRYDNNYPVIVLHDGDFFLKEGFNNPNKKTKYLFNE